MLSLTELFLALPASWLQRNRPEAQDQTSLVLSCLQEGPSELGFLLPYLCVNGGGEVAEQPHVVFLAGLHVHHQTSVQVPQLRGLGEGLVQVHLPRRGFAGGRRTGG